MGNRGPKMKLVIDASMALAWLFERKNREEARCAEKLLLTLTETEVSVPIFGIPKLPMHYW